MKKIVSTFAAIIAAMLLFSPVAQAESFDFELLTAKKVKEEVLGVAKKYAEATSCISSDDNDDDRYLVFEILPYKNYDDSLYGYAGEYGVIWREERCTVGNADMPMRIAFAYFGEIGGSIFVREDADFPDIPAAYCEKVISAKLDTIVLDCVTYRDGDHSHSPTQKVAITFKRSLVKDDDVVYGYRSERVYDVCNVVSGKWKLLNVVKTGTIKHH